VEEGSKCYRFEKLRQRPYYEMSINLTIIFSVLWVAITEI
jgi:hypothetical protein